VSSWLKCHEPACFLAALLNSQPMGFYQPAQLVQDAKRHGVIVLPVDVMVSGGDCTLEENKVVRLGLRLVSGLNQTAAERIAHARTAASFTSTEDLALRAALDAGDLKALASADALMALSGHRRQQVWDAAALKIAPPLLKAAPVHEDRLALPAASEGEEVVFDYAATGLTLRRHPLAILRPRLATLRLQTSAQLQDLPSGRHVAACGIVTARQQPQTAKGVVFVTLEDETGSVNVIVWKSLREQQRSELLKSRLMAVYGQWQRDTESGGQVRHLVARRLKDLTPMLGRLGTASRDFR
jgi:error-prone DNA polymerase